MKNRRLVMLVTVFLMMSPAFAQDTQQQDQKPITELQVRKAISLLIKAGILSADEGRGLKLERPSILQELEQKGHVESGQAEPNAICAKEM